MILLLDANLSWRLIKKLEGFFPDIRHADSCGLGPSPSDRKIWEYARNSGALIVSNDEDFSRL